MIQSILIAAILGAIVGCATVSSHMSKGIGFKQNHSGFMLYDPVSNKVLDEFQAEKYTFKREMQQMLESIRDKY